MTRTFRSLLLVATACISSAAAAVTINFDNLASGTTVGDAYVASGARFLGSFTATSNTFNGAITVPSPPNYLSIDSTLRFVDPANPTRAATTSSVSFVGAALAPQSGCVNGITLDAYGLNNNLLGSQTIPAAADAGRAQSTTTLTFPGIHEIRFTNLGGNCIPVPLDDVSFVAVIPAPVSPALTKSFAPTTIAAGGTTTLTFTLTSPANNPQQTVSFTDNLPAGLQIAATPNAQSTCTGVASTANAGGSAITITSATLAATVASPGACTLSFDITNVAQQSGTCPSANFTNASGNISGAVNVNNAVIASCVTVTVQTPSLNKAFSPTIINAGGISTLIFTITNPPPGNPAQSVSFTDTLPTGLKIAATPNVGGTCTGGAVTAAAGGNSITVTGRSVPASSAAATNCTVTVDVTNVTGQLNASCTSNPVAFTNGSGNIGGLSNLTNSVTQSCLVVNGNTFSISKVASGNSLATGSPVNYTITVTNNGPSPASGSILTDPAIAGFAASAISCTNATNGAACPASGNVTLGSLQGAGIALATFPSTGTITFVLSGTFTQASGSTVNTATVSSPAGVPFQTASAAATVTVAIPAPLNIPTMSEQALLALMLVLAAAGALYLNRRRRDV